MKALFAVGVVLLSVGLTGADNYQRTYQQPVIYVPSYGGGVSQQLNGMAELLEEFRKLRQEISALRAENRALRLGVQADAPPHIAVYMARCVQCHDSGVAKQKGGGFALMDGNKEIPVNAETKLEIIRRVHENEMPKGGPPLTTEEYSKLTASLAKRNAQK